MTGINIHRTAKPVTSWLRGRIHPMRQEDAYFWQWKNQRKPKPDWYGKGKANV